MEISPISHLSRAEDEAGLLAPLLICAKDPSQRAGLRTRSILDIGQTNGRWMVRWCQASRYSHLWPGTDMDGPAS